MINKKLAWLKRGMCMALAGIMILSSDAVLYAAEAGTAIVTEAVQEDDTETGDDSELAITAEMTETTESTENVGETESTETTETTENTEIVEPTETVEPTESTEDTENVEPTETVEPTESTEPTEDTEDTEDTEKTVKKEIKGEKVSNGISFDEFYTITDIGNTMELPAYTVSYEEPNAAGDEAEVEWQVVDGIEVITLDADNNRVIANKAGTAKIRVSIKNKAQYYDEFLVVVRPVAAKNAIVSNVTYNSVKITWDKVTDADGYTIKRKIKGETGYTVLKYTESADTTSYIDTNLVAGTEVTYSIYPYVKYSIENGKTSPAEASTPAVVTATPSVGKPVISGVASKAYNTLAVTWAKVEGASGYTVYRATGSSTSYKEIGSVGATTYTYTDATVSCGTSYSYQVRAYSTVNGNKVYGEYSKAVSGKSVPAATTVSASVKSYESIALSWTKVDGVSGYAVYRKTGNDGDYKKYETVKGASKVSYTDENVDTGTKYYYKVRTYRIVDDETVWGTYSNEVTVTPTMTAPKVTLQNKSYNSITVKWNKISGADGYKVTRSDSENGTYKTVKTVKDCDIVTYTDTGLTVGNTYYYKVYAYRSMDDGNVNGSKSSAVALKAIPGATTVKSEAAGATQIKLTWSKVELPSSNSGYYVYQIVNGSAKKIKTCNSSTTSATITKLTAGTSYKFKVVAFAKDKSGRVVEGASSNTLTATPTLLTATVQSTAKNTYNSVKVTWSSSKTADEDTYLVYRATSKNGKYKKVGTVSKKSGTTSYTYTDSGVKLGSKYYYKVVCTKNVSGKTIKSGYSNAKSVTVAPGTASLKIATAESGKLTISWNAVKKSSSKNVDGYVIYRSTSKNGSYSKVKDIAKGSTTSYTDSGLTNGKTYYYKIRTYATVSGKKIYSEYSSIKSKKVVPGTPSVKAAAADYKTVTVSWDKVSGCDGYVVYRATSKNGKYKSVKTIKSGSTTSYKNGKLKTGTKYYYKVRAYDIKGGKKIYSEYSKVKSATPVLTKPTGLVANATDSNQIKLTWNKVTGAETYTILRSTSQNGTYKIATEICTTTSYVDTNVSVGKTYYYKIYAVRGNYKSAMTDCVTAVASVLTVNVDSVIVKTGGYAKLSATVKPSGYVAWTSVDPTIAVVSSDGTVYGMKAGTTKIKATANGITKEIPVTVKDTLDKKGIDISSANGTVDFNAIKASGYEFVMLRISNGTKKDSKFETNYTNAKAAGLKVGVYCTAKATTVAKAETEAANVISYLGGRVVDYPVVYQIENENFFYSGTAVDRSKRVLAFKNKITAAVSYTGTGAVNYGFALGANKLWMTNTTGSYFDLQTLGSQNLWLTSYTAENLGPCYTGKGTVIMWRYTNQGTVSGVKDKSNINISYWN